MSKALFITVKDLKDNSIIDGNTDGDKLIHFIEVAQDINIHQYLGTSLYDKLQSLIIQDTINDSANSNYKYLRDQYIKPCLIWFTQIEFLLFSMFTIDNGGLTRHRGNNEDVVAFDELILSSYISYVVLFAQSLRGIANVILDDAIFFAAIALSQV